jgi:hypothetical protein
MIVHFEIENDSLVFITSSSICPLARAEAVSRFHKPWGLERRDRVDDFIRRHNGAGIVWDIDVESCVHLFIRVIRGRANH